MQEKTNKSILCVDEENYVAEACQKISIDLAKDQEDYKILYAANTEKAVAMAQEEEKAGRKIALCLLNLQDSLGCLQKLTQLLPEMFCVIFSPASEISREHVNSLFEDSAQWIYFKKPFSPEELLQLIEHLVLAAREKKEKEFFKDNLSNLITIISAIKNFNFLDINELKKEILESILGYLKTKDGILFAYNEEAKEIIIEAETGESFEYKTIKENIIKSMNKEKIEKIDDFLISPLLPLENKYAIVSFKPDFELKYQSLLQTLLQNMTSALDNAFLYNTTLESEKEKRSMTIKVLQKIMSTLTHHINNPLTTIKGYCEAIIRENDLKKCKKNILLIQEDCEIIHAAITILSNLDRSTLEKTIDLPVARLQLIDIENELNKQREKIKEKFRNKKFD